MTQCNIMVTWKEFFGLLCQPSALQSLLRYFNAIRQSHDVGAVSTRITFLTGMHSFKSDADRSAQRRMKSNTPNAPHFVMWFPCSSCDHVMCCFCFTCFVSIGLSCHVILSSVLSLIYCLDHAQVHDRIYSPHVSTVRSCSSQAKSLFILCSCMFCLNKIHMGSVQLVLLCCIFFFFLSKPIEPRLPKQTHYKCVQFIQNEFPHVDLSNANLSHISKAK